MIIISFQIIYGDDNFIIGKKERRGENRRGEEAKKSSCYLPKQIEQLLLPNIEERIRNRVETIGSCQPYSSRYEPCRKPIGKYYR